MDVELLEKIKTDTPQVAQKEQLLLPAPKTEYDIRKEWICKLAEEIHPGNWDFGLMEPHLLNWFTARYCDNIDPNCTCEGCTSTPAKTCDFYKNSTPRLLIRFPHVKITNSAREHYEIEDMYIAILFNQSLTKTRAKYLTGIRSTVTTKEVNCGFFHPHASRVSGGAVSCAEVFQWRDLCLGGDTELTDIMYSLTFDGVTHQMLHELLVILHLYVGWESIEGGPYCRFRDVRYPDNAVRSISRSSYLGGGHTLSLLLESFRDTPTLTRPELVGNIDDLAITNVSESIVPAIKVGALRFYEEGFISKEELFTSFGTISNGTFYPTFNGRNVVPGISIATWKRYETVIPTFNESNNAKNILHWKNTPVQFNVKYDPNGLGDEVAPEELPDVKEILASKFVLDPYALQYIVSSYVHKFKEFKLLKNI
jgi:hypothetical protein